MKIPLLGIHSKLLIFVFGLFFSQTVVAQTAALNVVSANAGYSETAELSMSWSIGEISVATQINSTNSITQGFQQSFRLRALPVELLYFFGISGAEGNELKWETGSEFNNNFFTLLRSSDGLYFTEVVTIEGAGSSLFQQYYEYLDVDAPAGLSYYQLKQTDFDGEERLSEIISLRRSEIYFYEFLQVQIFPNPTSDELTLNFNKRFKEDVQIQIYNLHGGLLQVYNVAAGQYKFNINLEELPDGVYFFSAQNSSERIKFSSNRIVKIQR